MLHFKRPACQAKCEAAPEFAGKMVVSPNCGHSVSVPMAADAITAASSLALPPLTGVMASDIAEAQEARNRREQADEEDRWRGQSIQRDGGAPRSWLQIGLGALIIFGIGAVFLALFVPMVSKVREAAARNRSTISNK
jgi:hypothetical protein